MKTKPFQYPMRVYERVIGILYIPIHVWLLPYGFMLIAAVAGWSVDYPTQVLIYYAFGALFLLLATNCFWRATIRDFTHAPIRTLQAVILGYAAYFILNYIVALIMSLFTSNLVNPNTETVIRAMEMNRDMMLVVSVLLAPIVEETMVRGALFGAIRKKSRILAYVVSIAVFSVYHLWDNALFDGGLSVLLYAVQYIPAGFALAWCYEWSGTLVAPVVMHALINLISTVSVVWR